MGENRMLVTRPGRERNGDLLFNITKLQLFSINNF